MGPSDFLGDLGKRFEGLTFKQEPSVADIDDVGISMPFADQPATYRNCILIFRAGFR